MSDKNIIEIIPNELVTNVFGPSTKIIGEGLAGIFNFTMLPLRKLNIISEHAYKEFAYKLNHNMEKIPTENRDKSKVGLALKATEDSKYQLDDDTLRTQFANLISNTLDNRVNKIITPRFSTVLSQLSSEDAQMLNKIIHDDPVPSIRVKFQNHLEEIIINPFNYFLIYIDGTFENGAESLDTLLSLGIVKIEEEPLADDDYCILYDNFALNFKNSSEYKNYIFTQLHSEWNPEIPDNEVEIIYDECTLKLTDFGKSLCSVITDN